MGFLLKNSIDRICLEIFNDVSKFLVQVLVLTIKGFATQFILINGTIDFFRKPFQICKTLLHVYLEIMVVWIDTIKE